MKILLWHRDALTRFGEAGMAQRFLNVLGRLESAPPGTRLVARINEGSARPVALGPNRTRLARPGDFNLELSPADLHPGDNRLELAAIAPDGARTEETIKVAWQAPAPDRPPPNGRHTLDLAGPHPAGLQFVDGRWERGADGLRIAEPYYDRVLGFGDLRQRDYEAWTSFTLHDWAMPDPLRDDGYQVVHVGLALRWPGHADDGRQPRVQWYPLGVTCELCVQPARGALRLRMLDPTQILGDPDRVIPLEKGARYGLRASVASGTDGSSLYRAKAWRESDGEPAEWTIEHRKAVETVHGGAALLLAHYSDVTFHQAGLAPTEHAPLRDNIAPLVPRPSAA